MTIKPPETWSDISAIAQSITAIASLVVAFIVYRYTRKQTAINSALAINNAWNEINKFGVECPQAKRAYELVAAPISPESDSYEFDAVVYMHLNVQEMYHYLNENGVIANKDYGVILRDAGRMLMNVPNLRTYLERGYNPKFMAAMLNSVAQKRASQSPPVAPSSSPEGQPISN